MVNYKHVVNSLIYLFNVTCFVVFMGGLSILFRPTHSQVLTPQQAPTATATFSIYMPIVINQSVYSSEWETLETQVISLVNEERIQQGCSALTTNGLLTEVARNHSQDMAVNDFFSHTGSDGLNYVERVEQSGYSALSVHENIMAGSGNPEQVVSAWMDSPTHKATILNCDLEETGVGYYYLADDTGQTNYSHYWTQTFVMPK